jgi:hypothetical protein
MSSSFYFFGAGAWCGLAMVRLLDGNVGMFLLDSLVAAALYSLAVWKEGA